MNPKLLALYGLKYNPFSPELPLDALYLTPKIENSCWRIEHTLVREGGFALIAPATPAPVKVSSCASWPNGFPESARNYCWRHDPSRQQPGRFLSRKAGDLFGAELKPHNRWGGFKLLRERRIAHCEGTLLRPVLLIDEAQEMQPAVLNELRLLSSLQFDSRIILSVVFAGDARLTAKLRRDQLLPLGSRIRTRLILEYASRDQLMACLKHLQSQAGNASLMAPELIKTLCDCLRSAIIASSPPGSRGTARCGRATRPLPTR
ncbi:MAG: AAA family ATPase [Methylococcales bacterium]